MDWLRDRQAKQLELFRATDDVNAAQPEPDAVRSTQETGAND